MEMKKENKVGGEKQSTGCREFVVKLSVVTKKSQHWQTHSGMLFSQRGLLKRQRPNRGNYDTLGVYGRNQNKSTTKKMNHDDMQLNSQFSS